MTYIESAAGVGAGGRTGLTAVAAGALFFVALLFSPLVGMIGNYLPITAPALIIVGVMMMSNATRIDWDDLSESVPAFVTLAGISARLLDCLWPCAWVHELSGCQNADW